MLKRAQLSLKPPQNHRIHSQFYHKKKNWPQRKEKTKQFSINSHKNCKKILFSKFYLQEELVSLFGTKNILDFRKQACNFPL